MVRTKNICELKASEYLEKDGYEVIKNGWPDFIAYNPKTNQVRFIEVKPATKKLKPRQLKVKELFTLLGLNYETLFVDYENLYFEKPDQAGKS